MIEADFLSAELSAVPAFKAKDVGLDRLFIGAYGHDDRVCAYPQLTALFASEDTENTSLVILADKEETGSDGNTGMSADIMLDIIDAISHALGAMPARVRANSKCFSADVCAAYDPNFAEVYERRNSAMISCGTAIMKFTGSRGKSSTNVAITNMTSIPYTIRPEGQNQAKLNPFQTIWYSVPNDKQTFDVEVLNMFCSKDGHPVVGLVY
jgi:aspartyl aminopeptidase